MPAGLAAEI